MISKTKADGVIATDLSTGRFTVRVNAADTAGVAGEYLYEVEAREPSGVVLTMFRGRLKITPGAII